MLSKLHNDIKEAARQIVAAVLADAPLGESLLEATVQRSPGRRVWNAVFTSAEGGPCWKSTGLSNRAAALLVAKRWEAEARARRARMGIRPRKPLVRVRGHDPGTSTGPLSQAEVAMIMKISTRAVRQIERRAIAKLKAHPVLRRAWEQYLAGELDEDLEPLSRQEAQAVLGLARTAEERLLVNKILRLL